MDNLLLRCFYIEIHLWIEGTWALTTAINCPTTHHSFDLSEFKLKSCRRCFSVNKFSCLKAKSRERLQFNCFRSFLLLPYQAIFHMKSFFNMSQKRYYQRYVEVYLIPPSMEQIRNWCQIFEIHMCSAFLLCFLHRFFVDLISLEGVHLWRHESKLSHAWIKISDVSELPRSFQKNFDFFYT